MIISLLYSLPLDGRLAALRSRGAERPLSPFADNYWLTQVGLDVDLLFSGRPRVRGASGQAIRWGRAGSGKSVMAVWACVSIGTMGKRSP